MEENADGSSNSELATSPGPWPGFLAISNDRADGAKGFAALRRILVFLLRAADWPQSHAVQDAIPHDQRVEKHGSNMREDCREQEIGENRVAMAQEGIEHRMGREDGR